MEKNMTSQSTPILSAQHATGPRTVAGKNRSRRNAIKHGIFSKQLILDRERRADFEKLHRSLREYFEPEGSVQEIFVEQLAVDFLRESRVIVAESSIIARSPAFDEVVCPTAPLRTAMKRLCQMSRNITIPGFDCVEDLKFLNDIYKTCGPVFDEGFCANFRDLMEPSLDCNASGGGKGAKEDRVKLAKQFIEREFGRLYQLSEKLESNESRSTVVSSTPCPQADLDHIIRYESHLSRKIEKKINLLQQLQRTRRGYPPPPTIKADIS
jgi:hypothetical protein